MLPLGLDPPALHLDPLPTQVEISSFDLEVARLPLDFGPAGDEMPVKKVEMRPPGIDFAVERSEISARRERSGGPGSARYAASDKLQRPGDGSAPRTAALALTRPMSMEHTR